VIIHFENFEVVHTILVHIQYRLILN